MSSTTTTTSTSASSQGSGANAAQTAAAAQMNPAMANYQYYQYMQYYAMYAAQQQASMTSYAQQQQLQQPNASNNAIASASMQNYYNYNFSQQSAANTAGPHNYYQQQQQQLPKTNNDSAQKQQAAPIKINLKYKQANKETQPDKPEATGNVRKSRFTSNLSISNVIDQQAKFKQQQQTDAPNPNQNADTTNTASSYSTTSFQDKDESNQSTASNATDIVFDIHKWPAALKAYCTKVYQHFNAKPNVSEDQVTKCLQNRITEAFKVKPDLNIDWNAEPLPTLETLKKFAPQQPTPQQQAAIKAAKLAATQVINRKFKNNAAASPMLTQSTAPSSKFSGFNNQRQQPNKHKLSGSTSTSSSSSSSSSSSDDETKKARRKRKHRSRSYSSSSSSSSRSSRSRSRSSSSTSSDENFISLSSAKKARKNANKKLRESGRDMLASRQFNMTKNNKNNNKANKNNKNSKFNKNRMVFTDENDEHGASKLNKRLERFNSTSGNGRNNNSNQGNQYRKPFKSIFVLAKEHDRTDTDIDVNDLIIIGTNQELEKEYLRLTGPPESHMIRPLNVLKKSLVHVVQKYSSGIKDYRYVCDQLKAIRQDLTVQMIQNEFTVEVYETHARIAIKNADRDEFNQCQSQLKSLYYMILNNHTNQPLTAEQKAKSLENSAEFVGYRLVYNMLTKSSTDLIQIIKEIKRKYSTNAYLKHLVELRSAWHLNNYVKFFKLYKLCDDLTKCLINLFIERERKSALKFIIKAYRPSIKLEHVSNLLAYDSLEQCRTDLVEKYKLIVIADEGTGASSGVKSSTNVSSSTSTSFNQSKSGFLVKSSSATNFRQVIQVESSSIEDLVLDCKSCNVQNL